MHSKTREEVLKSLSSNAERGLTSSQVAELQGKFGPNKLSESKKKTNLQRFLEQFKDVMIIILLLAAAVSFVVACFGHDPMEFFEPALILLIVVLNAVLGVVQESKAEKALDALEEHVRPPRPGAPGWGGAGHRRLRPGARGHHPAGGRGISSPPTPGF